MSRVLVVETRNLLRQAISLALFPDHEVQFAASLSDSNAAVAKEFDLIIIDSAALRETGNSISEILHKLQGWKVPTVWIDDSAARQATSHDKLVVLTRPIQKDALLSAITKCLHESFSKENGAENIPARERKATEEARTTAAPEAAGPQIIELVDVVAEPPERSKSKIQESRTK
jgi:DNA-binding NtrC family response regulator